MSQVALRPVEVGDLDAIFEQMRDPESVRMAAFTPEDPNDRSAFDAHMAKVMSSSENRLRAIIRDSRLVGTIASYVSEGATEVTYWIDRTCWGQGIATRALRLLLEEISVRPIRARAASDNAGSLRVLQKAGFHPIGTEVSFAPDGPPRSRRPFSSCLEHLDRKSPKEARRCNGCPAATSSLTTSPRHGCTPPDHAPLAVKAVVPNRTV